jgi:phosphatidylglycerol:prolipoprotein diacylglycerol transferase
MYPKLFQIGPVTIWSFGVMMALAFITTSWLLGKELTRRGVNGNIASWITIVAIAGGVLGAKLFWAFEHFGEFIRNPAGALFTGSGLTWYGGVILAAVAIVLIVRFSGKPFWKTVDPIGPLILLGYAIGRIGCFLSGDGDYGPPSDLPWAMAFPNGTVPTPPGVKVHPTPLYEIAISLPIFLYLWHIRKKVEDMPGYLFGMYMILGGCERFITEFWRLTPKTPFGLTVPQAISLPMIVGGAILVWYARNHKVMPKPQERGTKGKKGKRRKR